MWTRKTSPNYLDAIVQLAEKGADGAAAAARAAAVNAIVRRVRRRRRRKHPLDTIKSLGEEKPPEVLRAELQHAEYLERVREQQRKQQ